jgi:hypothetical protein
MGEKGGFNNKNLREVRGSQSNENKLKSCE